MRRIGQHEARQRGADHQHQEQDASHRPDQTPGTLSLQAAAGQPAPAERAVREVMRGLEAAGDPGRARRWVPYLLHAQAARHAASPRADAAYGDALRTHFLAQDDLTALDTQFWFVADPERAQEDLRQSLAKALDDRRISPAEAFDLARRQAFVDTFRQAMRLAGPLLREDEARRYRIDEEQGRPSQTRYVVLNETAEYARLALEPITGRSHQLRVHLLSIGHPIQGDTLYHPHAKNHARLMLHAESLSFPDPASGITQTFCDPAPF